MRAAVLYEPNAPLVVEDLAMDEPAHGQVLVRVAVSGVCHTQLAETRGERGPDRYVPHTLGHEGSGIVEALGPGVTRVGVGDHVVLSWIRGPGIDAEPPCYWKGSRRINAGRLTTFQEYTLASENRLTPIPKTMPLDRAALLGCAVPTGAGAILNTARVGPGSTVVVFGAGGIGLCALQAARHAGAATVVAVDVRDDKLERAVAFGATQTVHARRQDPVDAVLELTAGRGADFAIEAAGVRETMEWAFRCVRTQGGLAVLAGNVPAGATITIDPFALIQGKRLLGTWGGDTDPARDIPRYVDLYLAGGLKLDELITHRFRLDEVNDALRALGEGQVARAVIEL